LDVPGWRLSSQRMNSYHIFERFPLNHPRIGSCGMKIAACSGIMKHFFISPIMKTKRGLTIVELMIAMAIMAVATAIAIPTYNRTIKPTADLKGAARQVYSDIQLARLRAVSRNVPCGLDFDSTADDYIVFQDANGSFQYEAGETIVKRVQFAAGYGFAEVGFDANYGGGDGITFNSGGVANAFSFSTRGLPSPTGDVYLRNQKNPPEGRRILLHRMGSASIEQYNP
jgi:prepilin-type N-terminal cleavage/methylation domain-containing protein